MPQRREHDSTDAALFAELEQRSDRRSEDYRSKERQLMRSLGLTAEWWTGCSVLDKSSGPIHASPDYQEHRDWHTVHAVRQQLLAALAEQGKGTERNRR